MSDQTDIDRITLEHASRSGFIPRGQAEDAIRGALVELSALKDSNPTFIYEGKEYNGHECLQTILNGSALLEKKDAETIKAINLIKEMHDAEIARLQRDYDEEKAIVSKIWQMFGNPSYEELKGRSIYDLIDELRARLAEADSEVSRLKVELQGAYGKLVESQAKLEFVEEGLPDAMALEEHYVWASRELTRRKAFEKADICRIIGSLKKELESVHVINTMNGEEWQADTKSLRARLAEVASRRDNEQDAFAAWQRNALARQLALEAQCQKMTLALTQIKDEATNYSDGAPDADLLGKFANRIEFIADSVPAAPLDLELLNRVVPILRLFVGKWVPNGCELSCCKPYNDADNLLKSLCHGFS